MRCAELFLAVFFVCGLFSINIFSQSQMSTHARLTVKYIGTDFDIKELDSAKWKKAAAATVEQYWSGQSAPARRHFSARLLWSEMALYVQFDAQQTESLVVSDKPRLTKKTGGLWDRDVCEMFIAPNKNNRNKYFEFEIAPTGEWVDLAIEVASQKRKTDLDYVSGMMSAARIKKVRVVMAIKIPWEAFGARPKAGDVWLGNLFRCVGKGKTRGYLAWQPTKTPKPSFHVPEKFGEFRFEK